MKPTMNTIALGMFCALTALGAAAPDRAPEGSWAQMGDMLDGRFYQRVTPLSHGRALVVGGGAQATPQLVLDDHGDAPCEIFDVRTGAWTKAASLPGKRIQHFAVTLNDGRVLAGGGRSGPAFNTNTLLKSSAIYDPERDAWTPAADMPFATAWVQNKNEPPVVLDDGRVLVFGGVSDDPASIGADGRWAGTRRSALYDPKADSWSEAGAMNVARQQAAVVALPGGRVVVAGGTFKLPGPAQFRAPEAQASAEIFDAATGYWTPLPDMPAVSEDGDDGSGIRTRASGAALHGKRAIIAGGRFQMGTTSAGTMVYRRSTLIYDDETESWSIGPRLVVGGEGIILLVQRKGNSVVALEGFDSVWRRTCQVLDRDGGAWLQVADFPGFPEQNSSETEIRSFLWLPAAVLSTGQVLVAGGDDYRENPTGSPNLPRWGKRSYLYTPAEKGGSDE